MTLVLSKLSYSSEDLHILSFKIPMKKYNNENLPSIHGIKYTRKLPVSIPLQSKPVEMAFHNHIFYPLRPTYHTPLWANAAGFACNPISLYHI
jgi:hypothetical protein